MGLHRAMRPTIRVDTTPFVPYQEEIEEEPDTFGQCSECGSTSWQCIGYGRYSQYGYFSYPNSRYIDYDSTDSEGWDDDDGWECENGHAAPPEIEEDLRQR